MALNQSINATNVTIGNNTIADDTAYEDDSRDWIVLVLYLITSILAIVGNAFICVVVYRKKHFRSTTYKLIVNMAVSDIIGGIVIPGQWLFCSTYFLDNGVFAHRICGICKSLQILSYYVSTFTMTAIAIDRYRLICKPLAPRMGPLVPILITWLLGALFTSTTFFSMRVSEYFSPTQGLIGCRVIFPSDVSLVLRKMRVMLTIITQYVMPLSITGYFYGLVVYAVWSREQVGTASQTKTKSFNENKKRTVKMLITVTVLFGLAWFPTHLMHYLKFYTKVIPVSKGTCNATTFYMLCYWLGISSCCYNAFIYCYFNVEFKTEAIRGWNRLFLCLPIEMQTKQKREDESGTNGTSSTDYKSTNV
ncbi:unnamed protein product [Medioppia subpectinata]|uniref:G-protein coupled receptors family 1 profile domain-containing protein n=1 Tax=Medioppia subpectinata TaxID=1979941 RepID=A0A7R9KU35_9ACAR|nr:unnamed protein product [Medioppia subpectinata]CAG2109880.1 unnamed protein product [Medioppia subpectinata]